MPPADASPKTPAPQRVREAWRDDPIGLIIKVVGAVGLSALAVWCVVAVRANIAENSNGNAVGATQACQTFVKQGKTSSATAEFSSQAPVQVHGPTWLVTGAVASRSSLGDTVRNSYRCKVKHNDDDSWTRIMLTTSGG